MGSDRAEHVTEIEAPIETVFEAITDYESLPEWMAFIKECFVHERDSNGMGSLVEFVVDLKVKKVGYTLRYSYDAPHTVAWDYVEGDVKSIDGGYTFEELDDGLTKAHYALEVDTGFYVPGPIKRTLSGQAMRDSLNQLKERAEELAQS